MGVGSRGGRPRRHWPRYPRPGRRPLRGGADAETPARVEKRPQTGHRRLLISPAAVRGESCSDKGEHLIWAVSLIISITRGGTSHFASLLDGFGLLGRRPELKSDEKCEVPPLVIEVMRCEVTTFAKKVTHLSEHHSGVVDDPVTYRCTRSMERAKEKRCVINCVTLTNARAWRGHPDRRYHIFSRFSCLLKQTNKRTARRHALILY